MRMDTESAEERYQLEPVDHLTAETIFDARWAMTVLGEAMSRLRWAYAAGEKTGCESSTLEFYARRLVERCQIRQRSTTRSIRFAKPWSHPKDG